MSPIRTLIVDDEPLARRGIRQLLGEYPEFEVTGECRDGREALRALSNGSVDLVFLDVDMPGFDGLRVIQVHGADRMPPVVFVTAHHRFAVEAFEAAALDYLVKPVTRARFHATIGRVRERLRMQDAVDLARRLTTLLASPPTHAEARPTHPPARRAVVRAETGEDLIDVRSVRWIGTEGDQVVLHTRDGRRVSRESLGALEARLDPAQYARVHRSAIVRLDQVRSWRAGPDGQEARVILLDGTEIPVSRRRLAQVKALLRGHPG